MWHVQWNFCHPFWLLSYEAIVDLTLLPISYSLCRSAYDANEHKVCDVYDAKEHKVYTAGFFSHLVIYNYPPKGVNSGVYTETRSVQVYS